MKVHVGSDAHSNAIHSVVTSKANKADYKAPGVRDFTCRQCKWKHLADAAIKAENRNGSGIGTRAEHSIGVATRVFGFAKVRYQERPMNSDRVRIAAAAASIYLVRCKLLGAVRPHQENGAGRLRFQPEIAPRYRSEPDERTSSTFCPP
jgi:hypothetical protein